MEEPGLQPIISSIGYQTQWAGLLSGAAVVIVVIVGCGAWPAARVVDLAWAGLTLQVSDGETRDEGSSCACLCL